MSLIFTRCQISQHLKKTFTRNVKLNHFSSNKPITKNNFEPFLNVVEFRRNQAKSSILVQVQSSQSHKELFTYCNSIGNVKEMHHYAIGVEPMSFIIVEFSSPHDVEKILEQSAHVGDSHVVPVASQFMWFRASGKSHPKLKQSKKAILFTENGNNIKKDVELREMLRNCDTVSDQIECLYTNTRLNELGTRLRFLTAIQVENAVKGMFPHAISYPFGSSVNGFGKMGCDLDLVLRLKEQTPPSEARLIFHCKASSGSERTTSQRNMEAIGDLIQLFLPGCTQVRRILQARVPIIKYFQQLTDVECDLSMSNMSGVYMSDFLYLMGSMDSRVRPLVFAIRKWAQEVGLTQQSPGRWLTNFSLTLLTLAFLQKPLNSPPILPSLNSLIKQARASDRYITEDGIDCTFLRDISKYQKPAENRASLQDLLLEFFEYYAQFDFKNKAVCLNEAVILTKPEHCALYIVNPLERGLNVSKNVSLEELDRFKVETRNAAWILESQDSKTQNWGLLQIFESTKKPLVLHSFNSNSNKQNRLVEVSRLFEEESQQSSAPIESPSEPINYKSENIKKQVENIKQEKKAVLNELRKLNR